MWTILPAVSSGEWTTSNRREAPEFISGAHYITQTSIKNALQNTDSPGAGAVIPYTILSGVGFTRDQALIAYALILAINRPIEMLVTSLNCVGDSLTAIAVGKSEGKLDEDIYNS